MKVIKNRKVEMIINEIYSKLARHLMIYKKNITQQMLSIYNQNSTALISLSIKN